MKLSVEQPVPQGGKTGQFKVGDAEVMDGIRLLYSSPELAKDSKFRGSQACY